MTTPIPVIESTPDGLAVSSETVAAGADVQHKNVLGLIETHAESLAAFGEVAFETRPGYNNAPVRVALLNEQQSTLLMTFMRNSERVVQFKVALVKAFFDMAQRIAQPRELSRLELIDMARESELGRLRAEKEREAISSYARQLEPKAEAFDSFMDTDGTYSIGAVAKMLDWSQNKLFTELRNLGVLIAKGAMRNTPYQQYMHHFVVRAHEGSRNSGDSWASYTTRVQPSGVDFIRRKLNVPAAA